MWQKSKMVIVMAVCLGLLVSCGIAANGEQGPPGVGINNIINHGDGTFTINLTDGSTYTVGNFMGPQGDPGPGLDTLESSTVLAGEWTNSTSWTDLSTPGPTVNFSTPGGLAIVILTAHISPAVNCSAYMSFEASGPTSFGPYETYALSRHHWAGGGAMQASAVNYISLSSGNYTITAKYKVGCGNGTFTVRKMIVIPIDMS